MQHVTKLSLTLFVMLLGVVVTPAQPSPAASSSASAPKSNTAASGKPAMVVPPEKSQPVRMPKFERAPVIDGKLDDEIWKASAVLKDFYQTQPGDNIAPTKPTEVFLGYDAKFIYVAFHCFDEPDKVRATIPKRDNIWNDDYVGILFDTFNDGRKAYEFDFSPYGIQADGIWTDGQGEDFSLDIVMESKGVITEDGWTVEVAIPFKSLRYVAGKDKLWGAHFWRRIKRVNNELDMWMPMSRDNSSWLAQEGHLSGLDGISTERTLELIPSVTVSETATRKATLIPAQVKSGLLDPGRLVNAPITFDLGLTGKYTITPNVTLDFAINPDFAQIESDQLVVTANQRFPIFFPEKRPFFLEGIDIFQTQIQAVHTRTIVDPDFAAKLTGKINRNTFGLMVASDNAPGNLSEDDRAFINGDPGFLLGIPTPTVSQADSIRHRQEQLARIVDKNAIVGVLRLKHDVGNKDSYIGFLGTYRKFVDTYNELGGFDTRLRLNKQTTFSAQALVTHSRNFFFYPDIGQSLDRKESGFIYATDYNMSGRHFGYEYSTVGRTRYYRSDVGFNRRVNTNNHNLFVRYNSEPNPKAKIISWRVYDDISTNFDWQGRMQVYNNESQIQWNLPRQTYLGVGVDIGYERVFEEEFGMKRPTGSTCAQTNTCTFWGEDSERSSPNGGVYVFAQSTVNKKFNFNMFANQAYNSLDFDFGNDPKYPRASIPAVTQRAYQAAGLCEEKKDPITQKPIPPPPACLAPQDPGPGKFFNLNFGVTYQPSTPLNFNLSFTKQNLRRNDTGLLAFDENIVSLKGTYQFTRFIFARGRIDYDSLASNYKGQFLFGWTPNPGTALYIGYNDDLTQHGYSRFTGQLEPGFRRNGRTIFIKMSYLFRKSFG